MLTLGRGERGFQLDQLAPIPPSPAAGNWLLVSRTQARTAGASLSAAPPNPPQDSASAWLPAGSAGSASLVGVALRVARIPSVLSVVVPATPAGVVDARLARAFGEHLATIRPRPPATGAITSPQPIPLPEHPAGLVCLPHLLTADPGDGRLLDLVVWEATTTATLAALGWPPVPDDLDAWTRRLPGLLAVRHAARGRQLPPTPETHALDGLLEHRYLSFRLVLEHPRLFVRLTDHLAPGTRGTMPAPLIARSTAGA